MKAKLLIVAVTGLLLAAGCASTAFLPTHADADKMKPRWTDYSFDKLDKGYQLTLSKCGGCHGLYKPSMYNEQEWIKLLPEMAERAKIDSAEYDLILRYLIAMHEPAAKTQR